MVEREELRYIGYSVSDDGARAEFCASAEYGDAVFMVKDSQSENAKWGFFGRAIVVDSEDGRTVYEHDTRPLEDAYNRRSAQMAMEDEREYHDWLDSL